VVAFCSGMPLERRMVLYHRDMRLGRLDKSRQLGPYSISSDWQVARLDVSRFRPFKKLYNASSMSFSTQE
jgi:hypothetical protein